MMPSRGKDTEAQNIKPYLLICASVIFLSGHIITNKII